MKIAFDVDGVVIRSIDLILEHINRATGKNIAPEDLSSWDLEPLGLDLRILGEAVEHLYAREIVEPYTDAVRVLSKIYRRTGEPLLFITGRPNPETAARQLQALPWNPTVPDMIVTGGDRDKRVYLADKGVDFIVEDDPRHLGDYLSLGIGVGLMLQPWNRTTQIPVTKRFDGWKDIDRWFMELAANGTHVK
jgi:hypothetical protein